MKELPKIYEPQQVEGRIYQMWMDHDCFKAEPDPEKKPFSIVMPPPNVTGQLHMGHAMDSTLQDILTRFKRMQGYSALWLPGTDHAGIATQIKVEEELRTKEGLTRYDLGREKFLQRVWQWKEKYGNRIVEQQKKMGASCDWSRSRFTMDEGCSKAVRETFCELYDKGLIYKGSRIINWCPHCLTALSDAEVEYVDKPGHLWYIRYPLSDGSGDIVAGVVIGGIAAVGAYEVGTGLYRITQMDDVAMPTNRLALAKLLWERAGKPEPENLTDETLYSDMDAEDTDAQKAARWAVEQELLKDDTNEDEQKFHPAFPVSKLRVCLTWEKAKQKGLFDQNTEA